DRLVHHRLGDFHHSLVLHIGNHADYGLPLLFNVEANTFANRVLFWPRALRKAAAYDKHLGRSRHILRAKHPSTEHANVQGVEEVAADAAERGFLATLGIRVSLGKCPTLRDAEVPRQVPRAARGP